MKPIAFQTIDWSQISAFEKPGASGRSIQKILEWEGVRIRLVEYSPGFMADNWCKEGQIVHCLEGELEIKLENGKKKILKSGMSLVVTGNTETHRPYSTRWVKVLIVDGEFLNPVL